MFRLRCRLIAGMALVWGAALSPAHAADPVTDAIDAAYAPYRVVLFRTNGGAQAEAERAIAQTRQAWQAIVERFARQPPPPYDRDRGFAAALAEVSAVYARAAAQIEARQLAPAHETLEAARDLMAELRRRNQVVVFSDHMNAYHAQMERVLGEGPKMLAADGGTGLLLAEVGALDYLARRLQQEAPPALRAEPVFTGGQQAVDASVKALKAALLAGDAAAARQALGGLKGPYSRLFLAFG